MLVGGFIYALKSAVILSLLYLIYCVLLSKNSRFNLKRAILLGIILTAMALPLIEVQTASEAVEQVPVINEIEAVVNDGTIAWQPPYPERIGDKIYEAPVKEPVNWTRPVIYLYWLGVAATLLVFMVQLLRIAYFIVTGKRLDHHGHMTLSHHGVIQPFSFLRWTFIPSHFDFEEATLEIIVEHEKVHLKLWHSLDLVLAHLVKAILWFTPAVYFLFRSIRNNHEHQVDHVVVKGVALQKYTEALLSVSLRGGSIHLGNSFAHHSGLSRRLRFMTAKKSSLFKSLAALVVLLASSSVIFFHTSLYGQKLVDPGPINIPFIMPKGVSITDRDRVPDRFLRVMDRLKAMNPYKEYMFDVQLFHKPSSHPLQKVVFFDKLTDEEGKYVPMSKVAIQYKGANGEIANEIIHPYTGIVYELEVRLSQTVTGFVPSNKYFKFNDTYHTADQLSKQPSMSGDFEDLVRMITLDVERPDKLNKKDVPASFDFHIYFNEEGDPVRYMLTEDSKHNNEALYKLEGQVYKNLREKAAFFEWQAGEINDEPVKSVVKVSIPTTYL